MPQIACQTTSSTLAEEHDKPNLTPDTDGVQMSSKGVQ